MKKIIIIILGLVIAIISFLYGVWAVRCDYPGCSTSTYIGAGLFVMFAVLIAYLIVIFITWIIVKLFKKLKKK